jgi:hypothetical protein
MNETRRILILHPDAQPASSGRALAEAVSQLGHTAELMSLATGAYAEALIAIESADSVVFWPGGGEVST